MEKSYVECKILEAFGFSQDKIEFYGKLFDNFDCELKNIMGKLTVFVKLDKYPKTLEDLAKRLEKVEIVNEKPKSDVKNCFSKEKETERLNYENFSLIRNPRRDSTYSLDFDQVERVVFVS